MYRCFSPLSRTAPKKVLVPGGLFHDGIPKILHTWCQQSQLRPACSTGFLFRWKVPTWNLNWSAITEDDPGHVNIYIYTQYVCIYIGMSVWVKILNPIIHTREMIGNVENNSMPHHLRRRAGQCRSTNPPTMTIPCIHLTYPMIFPPTSDSL